MDVSNFLKKLKKHLSEKKQNEETEADGANLEERRGKGGHENRISDETQCNATSNKQKLNLNDQKNNYVTRELANVNDLEENNNFFPKQGGNIDDNVNDEEEEEEEEEDNVFFTATSTDTTHQRHRRKSMVSNYYSNNSNNNMIDQEPPVTLSDIKHYHILKDLPALNVMQANANKQGFHAQRSVLTTSLASTKSSQLSLRQKRHMLLSAMQNKAKETNIDKNHKHAREELNITHSMSNRNDDNDDVSKNSILEEKSVITDNTVQEKMGKRVKFEGEEHTLSKPTMATDVEKKNIHSQDNIKINTQEVKMLSVDELLSSASETALTINIDFSNLDSVTEILTDTHEITNNTQPRRSMEEEKHSFLEEQETNVAEVHNAHSANAEDKHNNINRSKSDALLDASTECAIKTFVANAKDGNNSVVDSTATATSSSSVDVVDGGKNAKESAPPSKQTKKLNAFARAKLLAQNSTLPENDAMLNARHDNQIHIQHFEKESNE